MLQFTISRITRIGYNNNNNNNNNISLKMALQIGRKHVAEITT